MKKKASSIKVFVYFKNVPVGNISEVNQQNLTDASDVLELKDYIKKLEQIWSQYADTAELQTFIISDLLSNVLPELIKNMNGTAPKLDSTVAKLIALYDQTDRYYQIDQRDQIITDAVDALVFLAKYNIAPKLDQATFYDLCHNILMNTRIGDSINVVSLMLRCEWDDSKEERVFWKDNQNAVKRRVKLERIFIVSKKDAHRLKTNPQIKKHISLEANSTYIHSHVVERDKLQNTYPDLLSNAGNGFILVNSEKDKIALLDEIPESGRRARPITDEEHLQFLLNTFNEIRKLSKPLKKYLDGISWSHYKKGMLSVFVTTKCNLNCSYCFTGKNEGEHRSQTIPLKFVKKGIDDYFDTDYMRHIRFFGAGEPTMEFELIKSIHKYAKEKGGSSVTFEIQTNGCFPDPVALWLRDNVNIVWISCDGTPDIQDKNRPFRDRTRSDRRTSSKVIEKNIRILRDSDKTFVGIRATITAENITRQIEMIDYFSDLGIANIWVDPIFPSVEDSPLRGHTIGLSPDTISMHKPF